MGGNNYTPESDEVKKLCYYYQYNSRHLLTKKREPGKGYSLFLYDDKDRLRLTQDSLQREKGEWAYVNYDFLGRAISTGIGAYTVPQAVPGLIVTTPETGTPVCSPSSFTTITLLPKRPIQPMLSTKT